jgi:ketosteroid isomerase-like protein
MNVGTSGRDSISRWRIVASMTRRVGLIAIGILALAFARLAAQNREPLPEALMQMADTERAFAARALVVGWKQAFLEYFSYSAIGFAEGRPGNAREQVAKNPDPPKDLQLIWEPRYGDSAASGELGYLTGPVKNILPSRNNGQPRHSAYFSIWKREADGSFKVVMDVGIQTPGPVPFPAGFTRAPHANRFTGDYDDTIPPLGTADGLLNSALRSGQARAYRSRLADGVRFHRQNKLPIVGQTAVLQWLASQPSYSNVEARYAESARSGDLGYTWGTYSIAPRRVTAARGAAQTVNAEIGFYVRVWVRERNGQWKLAVDVLQ